MRLRAVDFYVSTVKPTVMEYLDNSKNIRRGRLAAIVLYHMADYQALENSVKLPDFHEEIITRCPDFHLIRDVADASKHGELNAQKRVPRILSTAKQVTIPPAGFHGCFGQTGFAETVEIFVNLDNGEKKLLEPAIRSVLDFWEKYITAIPT